MLEFNCRFGDPETQALLMRLKSDLLDLLRAPSTGRPIRLTLEWDPRRAVRSCSRRRLSGSSSKGDVISGLEPAGAEVLHAGTAERDGEIVTAGGRVLNVTALGEDVGGAGGRLCCRRR